MKKNQILSVFISVCLIFSVMFSIDVFAGTQDEEQVIIKNIVDSSNTLGFSILKELYNEKDGENIFISPFSIEFALLMALNGAAGNTRNEMTVVLKLDQQKFNDINAGVKKLNRSILDADKTVQISIANALWLRKEVEFKNEFTKTINQYYDSEIEKLDFSAKDSVDKINNWVRNLTNNKIDKIIETIDPASIAFIMNAIYFKGTWTNKFKPENTKEEEFFLQNNKKKMHPLMYIKDKFLYFETDEFQAVKIPYGKEGRIGMYVFLPSAGFGITKLVESMKYAQYQNWIFQFSKSDVKLKLPKFKTEYKTSLVDALKRMGMTTPFDENTSDFSNMCEIGTERVYINDVKHKTFIEVNEEGTEAAAVTSIEMRPTSVEMPKPVYEMYINRPFLFTIADSETGIILFMGIIRNP